MELEKILAISGKPGLFMLVASSRGGVIVESIVDGKRFPVSQTSNVSSLKDIAIYTYGEEVPLRDVFGNIYAKENGGKAIDHKSNPVELKEYMGEVLPGFDQERVYNSDLKKLFQWYNLLHDKDMLPDFSDEEKEATAGEEAKEDSKD